MWHPKRSTRITLGVIGVLMVLVGTAAWSFETEYGGNGPGEIQQLADGTERVYDVSEQEVDDHGYPVRTLVFEGTPAEVEAYIDRRRSEGRSYLIPGLIVGAGAILVIGAVFPPIVKREPRGGTQ